MEKIEVCYEVLNGERKKLLPALTAFKDRFYLAGGTGLALQIGHRVSEDFDFFSHVSFDNKGLLKEIKALLTSYKVSVIQDEENTFTVIADDEVKLSFFKLEYSNLLPLVPAKEFMIASVEEIGIMKLLALLRATLKDYVDLYFILQQHKLSRLMFLAKEKHPEFEDAVYLKSLLSYEDVDHLPITYLPGKEIKTADVFKFIREKTIKYLEEKDIKL
ncbi:MAG: nucleotidyl transferase AbiEii/AbiGii toxin family protein [Ignavibacteriaceae bacterium]